MNDLFTSLEVGSLVASIQPVDDVSLGLGQHTREDFPLRQAVVHSEALELRFGLDGDDHVDAFALTVNIVEVPLTIGGLAGDIVLR